MRGPDATGAVSGTVSPEAEDTQIRFLTSKVNAGHPHLMMGSGAWIDPANSTGDLVTARDGTAVQLRPLRRGERDLVARFFAGLSAESRRRCFSSSLPRLPEAMLRRLVDVDGHRHLGMVATVDGDCAGIARYLALADKPGAAEVAVCVTNRHQGRGIGRLLVDALRLAAVRAGLTALVYLVEPTNRPALRLLRSLGVELAFRDGLVQGRQHLPASRRRTCRAARAPPPSGRRRLEATPATDPQGGTGHGCTEDDHPAPRRRSPASTQHPAASGVAPLYQRLAAGSLIVAPLVLLTGELLHPELHLDPARQLAVAAANPDRWYLAHLLSLIGFALLVPAILGLIQLVGQRRAALADLGGTLALLGVLATTGLLSIDGFGVWQMAQPAADRAEMAALLERILTSPGVLLPLYPVSLASAVDLLVLTLGLYRAQVVPAWTAGLVAIGVAVWVTGEAAASKATMVAGVALLALGLGLTGRRMLTASTQQPPHGLHRRSDP